MFLQRASLKKNDEKYPTQRGAREARKMTKAKIETETILKIRTKHINGLAIYKSFFRQAGLHVKDLSELDYYKQGQDENLVFKDGLYLSSETIDTIIEELQAIKSQLDAITVAGNLAREQ